MARPWRFTGSKTEYFGLYAVVSLITAIVALASDEVGVGVMFFGLVVFFTYHAWRTWKNREY